jgi:putative oxidoreductase
MSKLFSTQSLWQENGLTVIRIITGLFMAYHGLEVFESAKIEEYAKWDSIKDMPAPLFMTYLGKGLELVTGLCFVFGFMTRIASILMALVMLFICFKIGNGKFWYEDQAPMLFVLLAMVTFFAGAGSFSVDRLLSKKQ